MGLNGYCHPPGDGLIYITRSSKDNLSIYWHNVLYFWPIIFACQYQTLKYIHMGKTMRQSHSFLLYHRIWEKNTLTFISVRMVTMSSMDIPKHCRKTSPLVSPSPAPNSSKAARLRGGVCLSWTLNVTVLGFIWKSYEFMNICIHIHANLYIYMNIYTFNYLYK